MNEQDRDRMSEIYGLLLSMEDDLETIKLGVQFIRIASMILAGMFIRTFLWP